MSGEENGLTILKTARQEPRPTFVFLAFLLVQSRPALKAEVPNLFQPLAFSLQLFCLG